MHNSQTHFLFKGSGHTLVPHSLETSGMWDRTRLRHATSLKDWLVCPSESSFVPREHFRRRQQLAFVLEISCPVLGKGSVKVHGGGPLPCHSLLFSRHANHRWSYFQPTDQSRRLMCLGEAVLLAVLGGCLGGQSCVHFTLCPFGLIPAAPSRCSLREQGKKVGREKGTKEREEKTVSSFLCVSNNL